MFKKILALLLAATVVGAALVSCGEEPVKEVPLADVTAAVKGAYGDLYDPENEMGLPMMDLDAETLSSIYGINAEWVEEYAAAMPMMMTNVDTYIIIKPTEGNKENVLGALNSYYDYLVNDSMQYPMNLEKVRAAQVFEKGEYVFFIMLGTLSDDALYAEGTEEEIAAVQYNEAIANNQKAIDAINALYGE